MRNEIIIVQRERERERERDRELLAVIFATKQFRSYLYGHRFVLYTDHSALRWLLNLKDPSSRLTRWSLRLAEFDYEIIHKPGKKMPHADALSRNVGLTFCEDNITEEKLREAQLSDAFCQSASSKSNFQINNRGILFRISESGVELQAVIP